MRLLFTMIISIVLLTSCNENKSKTNTTSATSSNHHIIVKEVLQTSSYTYILAEENNDEFWMAVSKIEAEIGDDFYYEGALQMDDFKSKELDRVFDKVFFVDRISAVPIISKSKTQAMSGQSDKKASAQKSDIEINHGSEEVSIAELYKNRKDYEGKRIVVKGEVVKVNENIMNLNWIHLQDGTSDAGNFDLTITTNETVKLGDVVVIEGKVSLDKDFGAGYSYELILEEASLK